MWDVVDTPRKEFLGAYVSLAHALSIDGDGYGRSFDNKEAGQPALLLRWPATIGWPGDDTQRYHATRLSS